MLVRAAIEQGIRPTSLILHKQPRGKWSEYDFLCSEAYAIVVSERCHCGLPRWICHNQSNDIGIKLARDTCFATKAVEVQNEAKSKSEKYKAPPGERIHPEPFSVSGGVLDMSVREQYYRDLERLPES